MRGIRGATTASKNTKEEIWLKTQELVTEIMTLNGVRSEDICAIIFSSTKDLTAGFPATGLRKLHTFQFVPLFDAQETDVENDLPMCIRVLVLADIKKSQTEIYHVYLNGAKKLRPDLIGV